jgi:phenylacetate-CoA ligase
MGVCSCGRTSPRIRCVGRTDDMLIVRGVNVFPTALRQTVAEFGPRVTGMVLVEARAKGVQQPAPLPLVVELAPGMEGDESLAQSIRQRIREKLLVATDIRLAPAQSLPRSAYKSKLVDFSRAE